MNNRKKYFANKLNSPISLLIIEDDINKIKDVVTIENVNNVIFEPLGLTPIHVAIMVNSNSIIRYLLELGADINKTNKNNMDCNELAVRYNNEYPRILDEFIKLNK